MSIPSYTWTPDRSASHICGCIGPQNGDPVCPCQMAEHNRRKLADMALDILTRSAAKPRIRVKAGRRAA